MHFRNHTLFLGVSAWPLAALALCAAACGLGRAQAPRPDLAGRWDLVYEDVIEVEVHLGQDTQRARVGRNGGKISLHDAGALLELKIDCRRADLTCPSEAFDMQLVLTNRMGDVNDDGDELTISMQGEGPSECRLLAGSEARARIESDGRPGEASFRAVALSGGKVQTRVPLRCFLRDEDRKNAGDAYVTLSTEFTALRH